MNKSIIVVLFLTVLATSCSRQKEGSHKETDPFEEITVSSVFSETESTSSGKTFTTTLTSETERGASEMTRGYGNEAHREENAGKYLRKAFKIAKEI